MSRLADRHPVSFSAIVTVAFVVLLVVASVVAAMAGRGAAMEAIGAALRGLMGAGALLLISSLGWRAWLAGPGTSRSWLLIVFPLVYILIAYPPLLAGGNATAEATTPLLYSLVAANGFAAGVMEELVFRGLILGALLRAWGSTGKGVWRALLLSSFLFSLPHALNVLAGADLPRTTAQLVWAFLLAVVLGALVVSGGTVWPAAVLHGVGNAVIHVIRYGHSEVTSLWTAVLLALAPVPLVVYAWFILRKRDR